jgi:hypothetical protein
MIDGTNIYAVDCWIIDVFFFCVTGNDEEKIETFHNRIRSIFSVYDVCASKPDDLFSSLDDGGECLLDSTKCADYIARIYYDKTFVFYGLFIILVKTTVVFY